MSRHDRLEIDQRVEAPIEQVWRAWTTEEGLSRWWWAGWGDTTYSVDAAVGGAYRIEAPGAGIAVSGTFRLLDEPERIEMTWIWSDDDGDGPEELVEVSLRSDGDTTFVTVVHTGPWTTSEPAAQYLEGWRHVLDRLANG